VWWDTSLATADLYRDEIMKQLASARAVIAIWTANSIRSDWVRAEAGRAKAEGTLIPVKTADVAYADIPLPFGEMHTENLESSELIRAAVVSQLAKPAVEPSAAALLTKGFKYELLTWVGIIGGALTLFTNLRSVLKLADWARFLVQHWKEWTHAFWLWVFGWLGIHVLPEWTAILSFLLFGSLLAIGQAIKFKNLINNKPIVDKYQGKAFRLISWRTLSFVVCVVIGIYVWTTYTIPVVLPTVWYAESLLGLEVLDLTNPNIITVLYCGVPLVVLVILFSDHRLHATVATLLILAFWYIIILNQLVEGVFGMWEASLYTALTMMLVFPLILLSVATAKAVSRRLIFLALGLLLLIALNELSKLGLDLTAPKLQG
jgi:hypothetical protein